MLHQYINFSDITGSLDTISKFCDYIIHPSKIFWAMWNFSVELSFILCLMISLGGVIMYIFGFKKYSKFAPVSLLIYTLIQCIDSALR